MANRAIKQAASKLEHDEMVASPTHTMKKRDEGGLASTVQVGSAPCGTAAWRSQQLGV